MTEVGSSTPSLEALASAACQRLSGSAEPTPERLPELARGYAEALAASVLLKTGLVDDAPIGAERVSAIEQLLQAATRAFPPIQQAELDVVRLVAAGRGPTLDLDRAADIRRLRADAARAVLALHEALAAAYEQLSREDHP